jgi:putative aldouronate transport system substrate-binding protein
MLKKSLSFILVLLLLLGSLTGCKTANDTTTGQQEPAKTDEAVKEPDNKPAEPEAEAPEEIVIDKSKPIRILKGYANFDIENDNSLKVLEEGTGFRLEFDMLPEKNGLDKLNMIFASGQVDYDYIMLGGSDEAKSVYSTYAKKGLLADLTDLIPKYPNLSSVDPLAFESVKVNDRVYAIGSTGLPISKTNNFIRMDWLETVGMDVPTTRDELYNVLKAFKEQDPGKLGAENIPFTCAPGALSVGISTTFGILYEYEDRDGQIVNTCLLPEYKEYLAFMNKLYKEGILDNDMPINTGSAINSKVASGKIGYYNGWVDDAKDLLIVKRGEGQDGVYFEAIPPFKDDKGNQRTRTDKGLFGIGMIPKSSDNVEGVLAYVDAYLEPEAFEKMIHGEEGVDYIIQEGNKVPTDQFNTNRGNLHALFPIQDGDAYYPLWLLRTRKVPEYSIIFEGVDRVSQGVQEMSVLAFAPAFDSVSSNVKIVSEYASQEATKFIAGARSLDEFDAFVEEMKAKGVDKIIEEYNKWYTSK